MEDKLISHEFQFWNTDVEEGWNEYVQSFALKPKNERVVALRFADEWLQDARPTKEFASRWQRKRDLEQLHWRLDRAGK